MKGLSLKFGCLLCILYLLTINSFALSYKGGNGQRGHRDDFMAVLPFVWDERLDEWGRSITDNLDRFANNSVEEYDGRSTYQYWKQKFGLNCSVGNHRYFFHWGYQRRPWSDSLVMFLPPEVKADSSRLQAFKDAVRDEQKRRNDYANTVTERILGFKSHGYEARYANAFVAIIYDVHILGDYETKHIEGLAPVYAIVAELNDNIRVIDAKQASKLTNKLSRISRMPESEREKANLVLQCLREEMSTFVYEADDGRLNMRKHFEDRGFSFKTDLQKKINQETPHSAVVEMVLVSRSGKYHKLGCHNIKRSVNPEKMTVHEAQSKGCIAARCCFRE